ncbi:MAG: glycerol-3-phosphate 1-O-acyltransferase PlsY [Elusimicrobiales bacterium]
MDKVIAIILSYLIGSIPTAYIIGRFYGIDIRDYGSGNVGATNVCRTLGLKAGLITFTIDMTKGFIPTYFASRIFCEPIMVIGCGFAAIIGHIFTVFLNFKGGKGVATSTGVFLALATTQILLSLIVFFIVLRLTGYVSSATLISTLIFTISSVASSIKTEFKYFILIAAVIIFLTHIPNIKRLMRGEELKYNSR